MVGTFNINVGQCVVIDCARSLLNLETTTIHPKSCIAGGNINLPCYVHNAPSGGAAIGWDKSLLMKPID